MYCETCKKRNTCVAICRKVEKYLSKNEASRRELTLSDKFLIFLLEDHLRARTAPYQNRHSDYMPQLYERLEKIRPRQRLIIEMKYFEGMSANEIARKLKISRQCANKRIRLAVKALRDVGSDEKTGTAENAVST